MCIFFHTWGKWSEPFDQPIVMTYRGEALKTGTAPYQKRACLKCGKIQEREI